MLKEDFSRTLVVPFSDEYSEQVLELAREMHAESASHNDVPMDEEKLLSQLRHSATNDDVFVRIAVRGREVLGGFFGVITTLFFSSERAAKDMAWFVRKNRRGSMAAFLLVAQFEQWAMSKGVRKFFLGQSTGVAMEATELLYRRLGYKTVGVNTVKVIGA